MSPQKLAPHVQQAICIGSAQAKLPSRPYGASGGQAAHVQAALAKHLLPAVQAKLAESRQESESGQRNEAFAKLDASRGVAQDFVVYPDLKSGGSPPPPPRRPIYALHCNGGESCALRDVKTGRTRDSGDFWGGFVRMEKGGAVYVSPRAGLGAPGDSHPTIASGTPEGMAGRRAVVAAGEVGILGSVLVGHNDKTGHFQSRKNRRQSGLPADRYHPFTEDPREWYKA